MVNSQRIASEFSRLAAINSPPLHEKEISNYLSQRLTELGGTVIYDDAAAKTGGECGNIIATFPANGKDIEPKRVERAIDLAMEKYCSASAQLKALATMETSYEIVEAELPA